MIDGLPETPEELLAACLKRGVNIVSAATIPGVIGAEQRPLLIVPQSLLKHMNPPAEQNNNAGVLAAL